MYLIIFLEYGRCLWKTESDRRRTSLWGVPCDDLLNKLIIIKTSI